MARFTYRHVVHWQNIVIENRSDATYAHEITPDGECRCIGPDREVYLLHPEGDPAVPEFDHLCDGCFPSGRIAIIQSIVGSYQKGKLKKPEELS